MKKLDKLKKALAATGEGPPTDILLVIASFTCSKQIKILK